MSLSSATMFSESAMRMANRLGLVMGAPNQEVFAETLLEIANKDRNVVVVTSDSRGSGKLVPFANALPAQLIEVGIAEQNLVGIAAGLASAGKKVFAVSPACFLTARSLEQIKNDVAYSNNPVCLVGISAGVSYGALGTTHHSLHDVAALRAINNLDVVVPADNAETRAGVAMAAASNRPSYLRLGKAAMFSVHGQDVRSAPLGATVLRDGADICLVATGETVVHALLAAEHLLMMEGVTCRVLSIPTIRPLDTAAIRRAAFDCKALMTVEEHMIHGGLGEACAAVLMQSGVRVPFHIVGIPDEYTITGSQADIFHHYGICMEGLAKTALALTGRRHEAT